MNEKNELLNALHNSHNYYSQFNNAFQNMNNSQSNLQSYMNNKKSQQLSDWMVLVAVLLYLSVGYGPIILFESSSMHEGLLFVTGQTAAIVSIVVVLVAAAKHKKKRYHKNIAKMNEYINGVNDFLFNCYLEYMESGFQVVPFVYCNPSIIQQFIFYIQSCRADSLKEAVNCHILDSNTAMSQHYQLMTLSAAQQGIIEARECKKSIDNVASILSTF